ncbi:MULTISPECIES: hypothetical protein [Rhizobium]|uniref:hypothetical protein n=1 Tax=Rhizobium TaxID=379 RepID=UPI001B333FA8|nr:MULTISPECIES: hypothetical protein [Rhizobium]MBX4909792.1 hypothetical protein [Rhizobium bangladeshense]MBX5217652.1 hypothetical protein [Rhizobium sp. NLR9a]MBX5235458.1 hypothetical protein [Rhizobium sp. NLR4a]MBX5247693.1 hypothetical protein [Rhizobium sp. NLR3b]MBX5252528.1 hypothetical protein [Rhizobium sp. NLR4b]
MIGPICSDRRVEDKMPCPLRRRQTGACQDLKIVGVFFTISYAPDNSTPLTIFLRVMPIVMASDAAAAGERAEFPGQGRTFHVVD